ncbi:hypothetical protein UFOVP185_7 [uncultured Caudovirales phage]|uniref:Uncharacterized protein n=1 Tax=uncultured Caudovirales phage TaxID=2100421 RepID=A0A6J7WJP3_9CAUD|nr:hypothetical protein UFOVP185_7 [uncultured Caudovirales phage]
MCDCKKKKEEPIVEPIKVVVYPDTPDGLLAKELDSFYSEEHQKLMDQINKEKEK